MPWWLRRIVDFANWLAARIAGRRYDVLVRRIGHDAGAVVVGDQRRRFLALQIDGLAHEYLQRAMAMGHTPALQRLVAHGYRLQGWRCGLPSSTPAVQAGIMYGNNWGIPAFRWYEKEDGASLMCKAPPHVERIKARVAEGRPGILAGGSSYTNMLDGDARLALFTLSAMGRQRFFEHLRGLGWVALFVLNPLTLLRMVAVSFWELLRTSFHAIVAWLRSGLKHRLTLVKPFLQVLTNIVFSEIQTFGIRLDVYRGMPAIYANFYGYDEVAHSEGPLGREALRALRRIDRQIRKIDRVRRTYWPDMELYVFSDHGMAPSVPFEDAVGRTLDQFVGDHVHAPVARDTVWPIESDAGARASFLMDELTGIEAHLSPRGRRLTTMLRRWIGEQALPAPDQSWDLARSSEVVVRCSGNLAHLYFNVTRERMDISEIAILYPDLIQALAGLPEIALVLGLTGGRPVRVSHHGTASLEGDRLPDGLRDPEQTANDLARLLSFPNCGDLVVIGAWDLRGRIVTFESQSATHGGAGGAQEEPFFLSPPDAPLYLSSIRNARELYPYFMSRFHGIPNAPVGP